MNTFNNDDFLSYLEQHNEEFLDFVGNQESQHFEKPSLFKNQVAERFFSRNEGVNGDLLPWSKTHDKVGLRMGEVSLWTGISGHGKSQVLGMVTLKVDVFVSA